jgi:hypothetical protein
MRRTRQQLQAAIFCSHNGTIFFHLYLLILPTFLLPILHANHVGRHNLFIFQSVKVTHTGLLLPEFFPVPFVVLIQETEKAFLAEIVKFWFCGGAYGELDEAEDEHGTEAAEVGVGEEAAEQGEEEHGANELGDDVG